MFLLNTFVAYGIRSEASAGIAELAALSLGFAARVEARCFEECIKPPGEHDV